MRFPSKASLVITGSLGLAVGLGLVGQAVFPRLVAEAQLPGTRQPQQTPTLTFAGLSGTPSLDAAVSYNQDYLLVFAGNRYQSYLMASDVVDGGGELGTLNGLPSFWGNIDAAVQWDANTLLLFKGPQYQRFNIQQQAVDGPPQKMNAWGGWPSFWLNGIDAATRWDDSTLLFFSGGQYVIFDQRQQQVTTKPLPLSNWQGWPSGWRRIDAAVNPGRGSLYFFLGAEYIEYPLLAGRVNGGPRSFVSAPRLDVAQNNAPPPGAGTRAQTGQSSVPTGGGLTRPNVPMNTTGNPTPTFGSGNTGATRSAADSTGMLQLDGRNGQQITSDQAWVPDSEGTIEFTVATGWDAAQGDPNQFVEIIKHGTYSRLFWTVLMRADQSLIGMGNGEINLNTGSPVSDFVPFDFSDRQPHRVALVTANGRTEFFVDGRSLGALPLAYGTESDQGLPLVIGPAPFQGLIGDVRIWNRALSRQEIEANARLAAGSDAFANQPNLVGKLDVQAGGRAAFQVMEAATPIEGIWVREDKRLGTPAPGVSFGGEEPFIFEPRGTLTLKFESADAPLAQLGTSGYTGSSATRYGSAPRNNIFTTAGRPAATVSQRVLVAAINDPASGQLEIRSLQQNGTSEYRGGSLVLKVLAEDRIQLGTVVYRRPRESPPPPPSEKSNGTTKDFLLASGIAEMEKGYHFAEINPWNYRLNDKLPVFDYRSQEHEIDEKLGVPVGLTADRQSTNKLNEKCNLDDSTQSYYESLTWGIGVSAGVDTPKVGVGVSASTQVTEELERMRSQRTTHCVVEAWCKQYYLQMDQAKAQISRDFRYRVEDLKTNRDFDGFIQAFGTHYAHAIVFGSKGVQDEVVTREEFKEMVGNSLDVAAELTARAFVAAVDLKANRGTTTRASSDQVTENRRRTAIGSGGGSPGQVSCDDTTGVPIRLDLRLLSELLAPPFFEDPEIITTLRTGLQQAIEKELQMSQQQVARLLSDTPLIDPSVIQKEIESDTRRAQQAAETAAACSEKVFDYPVGRGQSISFRVPKLKGGEHKQWLGGTYYKFVDDSDIMRGIIIGTCYGVQWTDFRVDCKDGSLKITTDTATTDLSARNESCAGKSDINASQSGLVLTFPRP